MPRGTRKLGLISAVVHILKRRRFIRLLDAARHLRKGASDAMTIDQSSELIRQALLVALFVAAPVLLAGLVVGLIVSVLGAVTQVQEQTLSFIPKIVAMVVCAIVLAPWMAEHVVEFARVAFGPGVLK